MSRSRIYVDATTLIALGSIGELERLTAFDGDLVILPSVDAEVTTEPAATNVQRFREEHAIATSPADEETLDQAQEMLDEADRNGDVHLIGAVLAHTAADEPVAVVSDDRRLRTVARGLGARVTGTIGVVVRIVEEGVSEQRGKELVHQLDEHGLHMTAELRDRALELVETAKQDRTTEES